MQPVNSVLIAERLGISPAAFEGLVHGEVPQVVADKIGGVAAKGLQSFVDGSTSFAIATRLKCDVAAVQTLRDAIGREGAIGLLIGLCVPDNGGLARGRRRTD